MTSDQYFYVYSGMAQATGSLIALVGIFIVFRLELQRNSIRNCREMIVDITNVDTFLSLKDFVSEVKNYISTYKNEQRIVDCHEAGELAKRYLENLERHIENLWLKILSYLS